MRNIASTGSTTVLYRDRRLYTVIYALVISIFPIIYILLKGTFYDDGFAGACRALSAVMVVVCLARGMNEPRLVNPWTLFSLTPFSLLIYEKSVSPAFLADLSAHTWLVAILGITFFLLGLEMLPTERKRQSRKGFLHLTVDGKRAYSLHSSVLLTLSVVGGSIPFLASTFSLLIYPAIVCAFKAKNKLLILITIGFILFGFTGSFNKSSFLSFGMVLLLVYEMAEGNKSKTFLLMVGIALLMVLVAFPLKAFMVDGSSFFDTLSGDGFLSFLNDSYRSESEYYASRISWRGPSFLMQPYMYLTTGWANLQYVISTQPNMTMGLWLVKPILGYLQLDSLFINQYILEPWHSSYNTFGFLAVEYKDFAEVGVALISFGLGLFVRWVYEGHLGSSSPLATACYALVACATLEMFFSNHFFQQSYPFSILILCFVYSKVSSIFISNRHRRLWSNKKVENE